MLVKQCPFESCNMELTHDEQVFLLWLRRLEPVERLAVRRWLESGDTDLMLWLGLFESEAHVLTQVIPAARLNDLNFFRA